MPSFDAKVYTKDLLGDTCLDYDNPYFLKLAYLDMPCYRKYAWRAAVHCSVYMGQPYLGHRQADCYLGVKVARSGIYQ